MDFGNDGQLTVTHLSRLLRRRRISPVDLTRAFLDRIDRMDRHLNSFITVTHQPATAQAKRAERELARGEYRGPLHGIPICLKDLFYTRGVRTTAGSKILRHFIPEENAVVVDRLDAAGAILLGKTNLHEFAYGATNLNPHYGAVHNPWATGRLAGGSSGGSAAAVAAGFSVASLGTDTGGSIRIPSAACGCVGLKPTHGRVPLGGVIPLAPSLDHVGPICRCVEDAALVLEVIADRDPRESGSSRRSGDRFTRDLKKGAQGLRVGVPRQFFFERLQREVHDNVMAAISVLEENGADVCEVDLKSMSETARLAGELTVAEALVYHWKWVQKRPRDYGADLRIRFQEGLAVPAFRYLQAQELRRAYALEFEKAMHKVDVLAVPTLPVTAPRMEDDEVMSGRAKENVRMAMLRLTRPGNLTRLPAITVPCGFGAAGLPTGLQLIGKGNDESTVLRAAYAYEQATPWHGMFPADPS